MRVHRLARKRKNDDARRHPLLTFPRPPEAISYVASSWFGTQPYQGLTSLGPNKWGDHITHQMCWTTFDLGDPTVQDYRGASGNVAMVELGTRLAIERARTVTLHLKLARWSSIPTR